MKKVISIILFFALAGFTFGSEEETPNVLIELNTGYAIGIELPNSVPIELKLVYLFTRFGCTLQAGSLLSDDIRAIHIFLGPTFFAINNPKIRIPISVGIDVLSSNKNDSYFGIGGIISLNYSITKNIFCGINIEMNYDFNNPYEETVGYKDASIGVDENGNKIYPIGPGGNPIYYTPIRENKNHIGNNFYIKPTVGIGMQF
ncbi:MAG: hypothetical protein LBD93_07235 [Treponema sp.]|jgi:hypothetical protein|nr:hypothetical protein [Treponema sp.]